MTRWHDKRDVRIIPTNSQPTDEIVQRRSGRNKKNMGEVDLADQHGHYSFDYAQSIDLLLDPMQVRPLFFHARRKIGIFGVRAEAIPKQVSIM